MAVATARITHYAWPGGVAAIFEASTPCAAVFGPNGWHVGAPDAVFADGPPARAEAAQVRLRKDVVERIASLEFAGAALHTDFVHLDRYIARLQSDQASAVVLVLGPKPAVLDLNGGALAVIEPASAATSGAVIKQARGWIIVITGSLQAQTTSVAMSAPEPVAAVDTAPLDAVPVDVPVIEVPVIEVPAIEVPATKVAAVETAPVAAAPIEVPVVEVPPAEIAQPKVAPAESLVPEAALPLPPAAPSLELEAVFGRFAGNARYLLSPGVAENLPSDVAAELAGVVSNGVTGTVLLLLDGAHTLAEIASETGLTPAQVGGILEALVSHRLAFKYVSRPRPAAGASAGR